MTSPLEGMCISLTVTLHLLSKEPRLTKKDMGDIHRDCVSLAVIIIDADFIRHQALAGHRDGSIINPYNLVGF